MYATGQKVFIKPLDVCGEVVDRQYRSMIVWEEGMQKMQRRAMYHVDYPVRTMPDGQKVVETFTCGKDALRAADACCDGCSRWLPYSSFVGGARGPEGIGICFLCVQEGKRDYWRMLDERGF